MLFTGIFAKNIKQTMNYIKNDTDMGSYKMAKWINRHNIKGKIMVMTHFNSFLYYLNKKKKAQLTGYLWWGDDQTYNNKTKMERLFARHLMREKIDIICLSHYEGIKSIGEKYLKFRQLIDIMIKEGEYIKSVKNFKHYRRRAGSIIRPVWKNINKYRKK